MSDWSGKQIGKYQVKEPLGHGGMGRVYRAFHPALDRDVAIKLIHPHLTGDRGFVDRFQREAKIIASLRHPSIVQVHDFDVQGDAFYMVMEFIEGESLESRLAALHEHGERMPLAQALHLFRSIVRAMAYAHSQGVVHRDLKPANVLLTPQGEPILVDFGLSRIIGGKRLTATGAVLGTPAYMSPEQCSGEMGGARSDVYGLGVMLYELATGTVPFTDDTPVGVILKHISDPPAPPRSINPGLPVDLEKVIQKALAKNPAERFASAQEILDALEALVTPEVDFVVSPEAEGAVRCPYRGLQVFEQEHAEFFFGREALVGQLAETLNALPYGRGESWRGGAARFLAVLGASGSGKSSLVRAGLIPALRAGAAPGGWVAVVMTPGERPLEELAVRLAPIVTEEGGGLAAVQRLLDSLTVDGRALHLAIRLAHSGMPPKGRLLLVIDQFEELFTLCHDEDARRRVIENLLYAATASEGRVVVLPVMRADFYHRCATYHHLASRFAEQQVLVGPMNEVELRRAIEWPAQRVGLRFEPGLVDAILADVAWQPGALPLLQHALLELWERRHGHLLTLQAYQASGGVQGAIAQRAETVYAEFSAEEQALVRRVMLRLTQPGEGTEDTRRRATLAELLPAKGKEAVVEGVVRRLTDARLLTMSRGERGDEIVEVAHEALIRGWSRLRQWIDRDREILRAQRRLAQAAGEWEGHLCDPSYLYMDVRFEQVRSWARDRLDDLSVLERRFLATSALYSADSGAMWWSGGLDSETRIGIVRDALFSGRLAANASQRAISSLSAWAADGGELDREGTTTLLQEVASRGDDIDACLLALEAVAVLKGTEAVVEWWSAERQDEVGAAGIDLLARLWDRGIGVMPRDNKSRVRMFSALLRNRLQEKRGYALRWTLYGTVGSTLITTLASLLGLDLAGGVPGAALMSALGGLGLCCGLFIGELFEGWLNGLVRLVASVTLVGSASWLASFVVRISQGQPIATFVPASTRSAVFYTFAAGLGTMVGQLWRKRANVGYLVFGCLGAILMQRLYKWPLGALISLGVILGTGIARMGERSGTPA